MTNDVSVLFLSLCPFSNNHLVVDKKGIERCDWSGVFYWHKYTARCCCCVSTGERRERETRSTMKTYTSITRRLVSITSVAAFVDELAMLMSSHFSFSLARRTKQRERGRERKQIRQRQAFYLGKSYLNIEQSNVFFSFSLLFSPQSFIVFSFFQRVWHEAQRNNRLVSHRVRSLIRVSTMKRPLINVMND